MTPATPEETTMVPLTGAVFVYGLFMDPAVLEAKGIGNAGGRPGVVRDWALVGVAAGGQRG